MTGVSGSNCVANVIPALRNASQTSTANNGLGSNPSSINYNEPAYFQVGTLHGAEV